MNEYRSGYKAAAKQVYWTLPRLLFMGVIVFGGIGLTTFAMGLLSQPLKVIQKTFDADNMINNYEWFHDASNNFTARQSQVVQFKGLYATETDAREKQRLRIDMAAIQQSCRDLAVKYNAHAAKANRAIFMRGVPEKLNAGDCE